MANENLSFKKHSLTSREHLSVTWKVIVPSGQTQTRLISIPDLSSTTDLPKSATSRHALSNSSMKRNAKIKILYIFFLGVVFGFSPAWGETNVHRLYWTIPTLCEKNPHKADSLLTIMYEQLEVQRQSLGEPHFLAYLSAANAYSLKLHSTQLLAGLRAMQLSRKALQMAPDDPLTISVRAHILFYAPNPLGNKREALHLYERACEIYDELGIHDEVYPLLHYNITLCRAGGFTDYRALTDEDMALFDSCIVHCEPSIVNRASCIVHRASPLTPYAVATQVVAGTNYRFLCRDTAQQEYIVTIFVPLPCHADTQQPTVTAIKSKD